MKQYIMEKSRKVPVEFECEVLVAGGGIAGLAAAIAAARNGADVILVEREFALGGLATLGLITIYLPLCDGKGQQIIYGLGEELLRLSIKHGAEKNYPRAWIEGGTQEERCQKRYQTQYNPHLFALEVEKLMRELGIRILYGSVIADTQVENEKIKTVFAENKSGRIAIAVESVIDATGDADICHMSGVSTTLYGAKNGLASWYYYLSEGKQHLKMFGLADVVPEESDQKSNTGNSVVDVISNTRYSGVDGTELSDMVLEGHKRMLEDILQGIEKDPERIPVTISAIPLIRMSRRMVGEYALDATESHTYFEDSIGMTGDWRKRGPSYEIPFRCLYSNQVRNLLSAGRDISVTDSMWDITRVIPCCAVTGEAAGTAAALGKDFPSLDVKLLQEKLITQKVKLHG